MISSPGGALSNLLPTTFGFVLGLLAEPIRAWLVRRGDLKIARRETYSELAEYVAGLERVKTLRFDEAKENVNTKPGFCAMDWHKFHKFDFLLRVDPSRGLRSLYDSIFFLHEQANGA